MSKLTTNDIHKIEDIKRHITYVLLNHLKVLIPDRSTTAGRRKSFQRCKSVTPEEIDDPINTSPPNANHGADDIQIVQVHRGEKGV